MKSEVWNIEFSNFKFFPGFELKFQVFTIFWANSKHFPSLEKKITKFQVFQEVGWEPWCVGHPSNCSMELDIPPLKVRVSWSPLSRCVKPLVWCPQNHPVHWYSQPHNKQSKTIQHWHMKKHVSNNCHPHNSGHNFTTSYHISLFLNLKY